MGLRGERAVRAGRNAWVAAAIALTLAAQGCLRSEPSNDAARAGGLALDEIEPLPASPLRGAFERAVAGAISSAQEPVTGPHPGGSQPGLLSGAMQALVNDLNANATWTMYYGFASLAFEDDVKRASADPRWLETNAREANATLARLAELSERISTARADATEAELDALGVAEYFLLTQYSARVPDLEKYLASEDWRSASAEVAILKGQAILIEGLVEAAGNVTHAGPFPTWRREDVEARVNETRDALTSRPGEEKWKNRALRANERAEDCLALAWVECAALFALTAESHLNMALGQECPAPEQEIADELDRMRRAAYTSATWQLILSRARDMAVNAESSERFVDDWRAAACDTILTFARGTAKPGESASETI